MLVRQVEELHLLRCSLMGGETVAFDDNGSDNARWVSLLNEYAEFGQVTVTESSTPCRFMIKLDASDVRVEVELPSSYPESSRPVVSVRGDHLTKVAQERWNGFVRSALQELYDDLSEFPVYELISVHLLPLLHQESIESVDNTPASITPAPSQPRTRSYHALLTSHHLISPTKRRSMQRWSSEFSLTGFAKVGYPGVIYCAGEKENVEDFVGKVKGMQWLALRVRFVDELEEARGRETVELEGGKGGKGGNNERTWVELEKVGEVVEYMRSIGREKYVLELGLGAGSST